MRSLPTLNGRRVLVVSAVKAEAAYVPENVSVLVTGIGKVAAAVATMKALASRDDLDRLTVVNLGTAGALRDHSAPAAATHHGLYFPSRVLNHDLGAKNNEMLGAYVVHHHDLDSEGLRPGSEKGDGTTLATGDVFVKDPQARAALAEKADLVDMEGFAVVAACRAVKVPVLLVKHVSDNADETALDWPSRVDASARVLGTWLSDRLD